MKWYQIKAQAEKRRAEIYLYGDIVTDKWDETEVTAKDFIDELNTLDVDDIDLRINSPGGAVFQASAIYNALLRHPAQIMTHIDGVAASAASVIAMSGDVIVMSDAALMMIHNPWMMAIIGGDARVFREESARMAAQLDAAKESMLNAYEKHSTLDRDALAAAMDQETWYTAEQAVSVGLADEIFTGARMAASITPGRYQHPPASVMVTTGGKPMTTATKEPAAPMESPPVNVTEIEAKAKREALAADRKRREDIATLFAKFPDHAELCRTLQDDSDSTPDAASRALLDALGAQTQPLGGTGRIETGEDERDKFKRSAISGLVARMQKKPADGQNDLRFIGFRGLASKCLENAGVSRREIEMKRPHDMVAAAITHSTSDFPNILEDIMHKMIASSYMAFSDTWRLWCKQGEVSDFRQHRRLKIGSFGTLTTVLENGEYEAGTFPDAEKENQQATTKGKVLTISRQMLVNDDLDAFSQLGTAMGRGAARTVEVDAFTLLASNPTMSDGVAFFHANHNNLGSAAAPSVTSLAAAEDAMRGQTDVSGNEIIDVRPQMFLGSLGYARTANEVIWSERTPETTGSRASYRKNALYGMIAEDMVIGTPRISTNDWYLFANPIDVPAFEVAFLDGVSEPFIDEMVTLNPDGVQLLVRLDYGVAAIDWRGAYKTPA